MPNYTRRLEEHRETLLFAYWAGVPCVVSLHACSELCSKLRSKSITKPYRYEHEYHFHYSFYYGCTKERSHLEIMKYNRLPDPDTKLKERTHLMVSGSNCLPDPELEATASNDFISMSVSIYRMRQLASYSASVKERIYPWSKNKGDSSELFTGSLDRFCTESLK